jgi:probable rRNA maturation factor
VSVFLADEQDLPLDTSRILRLAEFVLEEMGVDPEAELSLLLVDRETMASLNARWRGKEGPTDVLSFPMDDPSEDGEEGETLLGDVVICPEVARSSAEALGGTLQGEVELLTVHGILHLLGYDHQTPEEEQEMKAKEEELLGAFLEEGE